MNEAWSEDQPGEPSSCSGSPSTWHLEPTQKTAQGKGNELLALIMGSSKETQEQRWVDEPAGSSDCWRDSSAWPHEADVQCSEDTDGTSYVGASWHGSYDTTTQGPSVPQKVSIFDSVFREVRSLLCSLTPVWRLLICVFCIKDRQVHATDACCKGRRHKTEACY